MHEIESKDKELASLNQSLAEAKNEMKDIQQDLEVAKKKLSDSENEIKRLSEKKGKLEAELAEINEEIAVLKIFINTQTRGLEALEGIISLKQKEIDGLNERLQAVVKLRKEANDQNSKYEAQLKELETLSAEKSEECGSLEKVYDQKKNDLDRKKENADKILRKEAPQKTQVR